jgi:hypothetical protein
MIRKQELLEVLREHLFDPIEDLPEDLIEEMTEAFPEIDIRPTRANSAGQLPTGQPFRLSDNEDFPFGTYIVTQTAKVVNKHFRYSDEFKIKQEDALKLVEKLGYTEIHSRDFYGHSSYSSTKVFEKRVGDGIVLISIGSIINKWVAKVAKSYRNNLGINLEIYSNGDIQHYEELVDKFISLGKKRKPEPNNVALVIQTSRGYDTQTFPLPKQKLDIELNYGKAFKPIHEKIIDRLNVPKGKGLVLLHGTPGTGKTHYLKYIASKIKDKRVLFIPPYLADFITSPEMTPFLIQNSNSVLFIEDAERVITDRNSGGSTGVSNILNITDGILSDILNIQIVATFNMDKKQIDSALLRKGRLIAEHKFDVLPVDDSNALIKHLGFDYVTDKPMTLTEIYNLGETEYKSEDKGKNSIGFNRY